MPDDAPNPLASRQQAESFLQSYWQIKPAIIRHAIAPEQAGKIITARQLRALATRDDVESRLIQHASAGSRTRRSWTITDGPFAAQDLPRARTPDWTVLVQGVDTHHEPAHELINRFRFVPDARLDDLMVSLAGSQGGVGPHIDSYDVFLLQLAGEREWSFGFPAPDQRRYKDNLAHRILRQFRPSHCATLGAGDMLYLPAGWAHDGIAIGPCMTASIGFRTPSQAQLLSAWLSDAAWQAEQDGDGHRLIPRRDLHGDPQRARSQINRWRRHPAQIDTDYLGHLSQWLDQWQPRQRALRDFVGRYLSEPKPSVWFERNEEQTAALTASRLRRQGIALDRRTRMLWYGESIFINGHSLRCQPPMRTLLRRLADLRALPASESKTLLSDRTWRNEVFAWHQAGWIHAAIDQASPLA